MTVEQTPNTVQLSCFVYVDTNTNKILGTSQRDNRVFENALVIELPDTPYFDNWWDYKVVDGAVVPKTPAEPRDELDTVKLLGLRMARDSLLAETDWWVLPDRTPTQGQLDYRQALRDITNTYSSLDDVVWPEKP